LFKKGIELVSLMFLILAVSACDRRVTPQSNVPDRVIVLEDIQLQIAPGDIPVETLLSMQLRSETPIANITAELTGVNMYMGRIPVLFIQQPESGVWQAELMLGACRDPKMAWQLTLNMTDDKGLSRQLVTEFQSSWR